MASLDLLRVVAALAVLAFHYLFRGAAADGYLDVTYPELAGYALFGYLGVQLFFLISGYVIAWSAEGRSAFDFAFARFSRLVPGYLAGMTLTFAILLVAGHPALPVSASQYVANLFFFAPALGQPFVDGVYWSIMLEIVFYAWVAVLIALGLFQSRLPEWIAGWMLLAALNEFVLDSGALRLAFVTEYAGFFSGGVLAFHMRRHGRTPETLVLMAAAFLLAAATAFRTRGWMLDHYDVALSPVALVTAAAVIHLLFHGALALKTALPGARAIGFAGLMTYPLYLVHQNAGYIVIDALEPALGRWGALAATLVLACVVSAIIVRYVERPARRLLSRLGERLRRIAPLRPA
ncbi:MAG: acyltransferase [Rhizobiaceae bacterium]